MPVAQPRDPASSRKPRTALGQTGGERHLRRVPARDGRQVAIRALDVRFLHAGIDQPNDATAEHEEIADLQLFDEIFLDRSEPAPAEEHVDKTLGDNRADVDQKFPGHPWMRERDHAVINRDLPEEACVLPLRAKRRRRPDIRRM